MATCIPIRIPGTQGESGVDGTNGTNGYNAFSTVAVAFAVPAQQASVLVTLTDPPGNRWMVAGQIVAVQSAGSGGAVGYYRVVSLTGTTQATLLNLRDDTTGAYATNLDGTGTIVPGLSIAPAGQEGPAGTAGTSGAPADAEYIVATSDASLPNATALDGLSTGFLYNTSGNLSIYPDGVGDLEVPLVDQPGGLISGDVVFASGDGLQTKTDAAARTALGLGTLATQDANNVNITGGTITGVTLPGPTALYPKDYLLFQHQLATGSNAGAFNQGSWVTVPLNVEVADTGNYGSIAANTITLAAGTYRARWRVCGLAVDSFQSRLYNVSTASVIAYGSNAEAASTDASSDWSEGESRFTLGVSTQVRLEAQCALTNGTTGFGKANNFGGTETYAAIELEREAS